MKVLRVALSIITMVAICYLGYLRMFVEIHLTNPEFFWAYWKEYCALAVPLFILIITDNR